jgi:hypothetical protein
MLPTLPTAVSGHYSHSQLAACTKKMSMVQQPSSSQLLRHDTRISSAGCHDHQHNQQEAGVHCVWAYTACQPSMCGYFASAQTVR